MAGCCGDSALNAEAANAAQARMLRLVLAINAVFFVVEFGVGWLAGSTALLADSLDMLGDALAYGFSLYAVARETRLKAISAGFKGGIMAVFGIIVLAEAAVSAVAGGVPQSALMTAMGTAALLANGVCLLLLTRFRGADVNMRSAWLCSRNDLIANVGVLIAAACVAALGSRWPDILIGLGIATLFLHSAITVLADARGAYHASEANQPSAK